MNTELFKQAQAKIAINIATNETLEVHVKLGKVAALVAATGAFKKSLAPVLAGAGIAVLAATITAAAPGAAHAQNWGGYGAPSYSPSQQQQAILEMQQRAQRQAEDEARHKREVESQTANVLGDVVANIAGQVAYGAGGNYNQSNSVRDLSKLTVNVAYGKTGSNTAERLGIGAMAGSVLAGMLGNKNQNAGIRAAVGAAVGAGAGYAWDKVAESRRAAPVSESAPVYAPASVSRAPQYQPQAQPQYQQQNQPFIAAGSIENQSSGLLHFTRVDSIPSVRGANQMAPGTTRGKDAITSGKVVYEPASMGLPAVMVEVARSRGIGIVAPGTREVVMTPETVRADPLLDGAFTSMAAATDSLARRTALLQLASGMRNGSSVNQLDVGSINQQVVQADAAVRQNIGNMLNAINNASAVGGYNTRHMMDLASEVVSKGYLPDGGVQYRPNTKYSMAPR